MGQQRTFAELAWSQKGKVTRRERFLAEMNAVIPWKELMALIEPHYPKGDRGRPTLGLEKMLRIYFLQQWFDLSDPQAEDAIYDVESMRRFVVVDLSEDVVPDESSILRFRHLLEAHRLTEGIFSAVRGLLEARGLLVKAGTIVDATVIHAPSSTKNVMGTRDPEMRQGARRGPQLALRHEGARGGRTRTASCTVSRRRMRRRPTRSNSRSCCTGRSGCSTGIRPTGARPIGRRARRRGSPIESIGARRTRSGR